MSSDDTEVIYNNRSSRSQYENYNNVGQRENVHVKDDIEEEELDYIDE